MNITTMDRKDRMWRIWQVLDPKLHWVDKESRVLDGLRFTGSQRAIEPQYNDDQDAGLPYLWVAYDMSRVF